MPNKEESCGNEGSMGHYCTYCKRAVPFGSCTCGSVNVPHGISEENAALRKQLAEFGRREVGYLDTAHRQDERIERLRAVVNAARSHDPGEEKFIAALANLSAGDLCE